MPDSSKKNVVELKQGKLEEIKLYDEDGDQLSAHLDDTDEDKDVTLTINIYQSTSGRSACVQIQRTEAHELVKALGILVAQMDEYF